MCRSAAQEDYQYDLPSGVSLAVIEFDLADSSRPMCDDQALRQSVFLVKDHAVYHDFAMRLEQPLTGDDFDLDDTHVRIGTTVELLARVSSQLVRVSTSGMATEKATREEATVEEYAGYIQIYENFFRNHTVAAYRAVIKQQKNDKGSFIDYSLLDRKMLCNFWSGLRKQSFTKAVSAERAAMEREGKTPCVCDPCAVGVLQVCQR
jgi:hypothetical protein